MIAVIFEVEPSPGRTDDYLEIAASLRPMVEDIDGFISIERFQSLVNPEKILSLSYWREKGWIHKDDPRGWFQWYCRYYMGRRHEDDDRQVRRWKAMALHIAQIRKNCIRGDLQCRPRQRQALLHWAYDSRDF